MTKYLGFPKYAETPCGIPETFATAYTGTSSYWNQDVSFFLDKLEKGGDNAENVWKWFVMMLHQNLSHPIIASQISPTARVLLKDPAVNHMQHPLTITTLLYFHWQCRLPFSLNVIIIDQTDLIYMRKRDLKMNGSDYRLHTVVLKSNAEFSFHLASPLFLFTVCEENMAFQKTRLLWFTLLPVSSCLTLQELRCRCASSSQARLATLSKSVILPALFY